MNPELPPNPREELEAQITALLLGELSEPEAAALREKIAADPDLVKLHTRLGLTIGLVKQALASPEPAELAAPEGLKLSGERREKLMASFKVTAPAEFQPKRIDLRSWGALAAMVAGLLGIINLLLPKFTNSNSSARLAAAAASQEKREADVESVTDVYDVASGGTASTPTPAPSAPLVSYNSWEAQKGKGADLYDAKPKKSTPIVLPALQTDARTEERLIERKTYLEAPQGTDGQVTFGNRVVDTLANSGAKPTENAGIQQGSHYNFVRLPAGGMGGGEPGLVSGLLTHQRQDIQNQAPIGIGQDSGGGASVSATKTETDTIAAFTFGLAEKRGFGGESEGIGVPKKAPEQKTARWELSTDAGQQIRDELKAAKPVEAASTAEPTSLGINDESLAVDGPVAAENSFEARFETGANANRRLARSGKPESQAGSRPTLNPQPAPAPVVLDEASVDRSGGINQAEKAKQLIASSTSVQDARSLIEMGRLAEAEKLLGATVKNAPQDSKAADYLSSIKEQKNIQEARKREIGGLEDMDKSRNTEAPSKSFGLKKNMAGAAVELKQLTRGEALDPLTGLPADKEQVALAGAIDPLTGLPTNSMKAEVQGHGVGGVSAQSMSYYMNNPELMKRYFPQLYTQMMERNVNGRFTNALASRSTRSEQQEKLEQQVTDEVRKTKPVSSPAIPQPEIASVENAFSTFSLNVSDVSFKLAAASLEKGVMPDPATIRSEEFINAFDYRDPAAVSAPVAFAWERAAYPFAQGRDLLRFSVKTAAVGREAGRPLNLVLLLDNSGSMERADRVRIIQECLRVLATQLQPQDRISVVTFARTARLWVDGLPGNSAGELPTRIGALTPEGGTNLEEAMKVAYETAARHFQTNGVNRVVLLTDGAANLGDVQPDSLKKKVETNRKQGIALDCFGIGWEGLNDDLLEQLSRNGDGRYGFVNTPEAASAEFAGQLVGALRVAASDVKVQVEFNPLRATTYRQIGYAKHQLTKEQFRDNTVDAAEIGAAEAGNALYVVQVNPAGEGPIATVRVRFKIPGTNDYREHEWAVPYEGAARSLDNSTPTLRLAGSASALSEWLASSPYAGEVTPDRLLGLMSNVPENFANDPRPKQLEWMIRQARSVAGK